jgi:hypothetical protein
MDNAVGQDAVRWNIKVSRDTDLALRTFLGSQGMKKGDLSKFIEEAVRKQIFHSTVLDIKARNVDTDPGTLQAMIDEAVMEVRKANRPVKIGRT